MSQKELPMPQIGPFILIIVLAIGAVFYHRAKSAAPHPYAACAKMATEAEKATCRGQIDYAMSAGL
jgi:hypothetical protein